MNTFNEFILCLLICWCTSELAFTRAMPNRKEIDTIVEKSLGCRRIAGLSLAIIKDERLIHAKGYGVKDLKSREPVSEKTLFGIASLSKAFAATLLVKLLQNRTDLSLETTVKHILGPNFRFYDKMRTKYANLEDLLAHRMGIPSNNWIRLDEKLTRENLATRIKFLKASGGFRRSFFYSNLMYGLVTRITEIIGNSTWENLIRQELFGPLGMESSTFATTADPTNIDYAQGYFDHNGSLTAVPWDISRRWGLLCGSGCIFSNALDMSKWMAFQLNGGRNENGVQVLDEDLLVKIHTPINLALSNDTDYMLKPETPVTRSQDKYALGWKTGYYRGFRIVTHSGSTYGYRAYLTLIPDLKIGIFTSLTGEDPNYFYRMALHSYLADLYIGIDPWLNKSTLCTFPEPWNPKPEVSSISFVNALFESKRNLSIYEGTYEHQAYGNATIFLNKTADRLMLQIGFASFILYPKQMKDEFIAYGIGWIANFKNLTLIFKLTKEINSLDIPDFDISITFQKLVAPGSLGLSVYSSTSVFVFCCLLFVACIF